MSVAILEFGQPKKHFCKLGQMSLDAAQWPLGDRPAGQSLCDLGPDDHVVIIANSRALTARTSDLRCQVSIVLWEPPAIKGRFYRMVRLMAKRFSFVLTHNTDLLCRLPNARFVPHGGSLLEVTEHPVVEKTKRISLIASSKRSTGGQRLRHEIIEWAAKHAPDLDALGRGYQSLKVKEDGHLPYQYSVVIENSQEAGYFTEKLIDSFLCRSLPIYWGAPDIEHFFDRRGMILCTTPAELRLAIERATPEDYDRRLPYLEANRERAKKYVDQVGNAARCLAESGDDLTASENSPKQSQSRSAA